MTSREQIDLADRPAAKFDEERIDALFAALNQCHLAGVAVGIAINGVPVYRKGFGLASMELPVLLTPSTRMRIYSVTKHFTCLAYLLLCEEGLAGTDDAVGKHFPEFHAVARSATMRQLMGNISGLRDAHALNFQFCGTQWVAPSADVLALYQTIDDVDASPGSTWIYNNGGFVLLSHAIERISGQSLGEFMRRRIFEPVGMYDTLLRRTDTDFVPGSATMHMINPQGNYVKSYVGGDRSGTGGIVSTVNDMLRWLAHMDAPRAGSPETWELIRSPQTLINGTSTGYGCGLFRDSYRGVEVLYHPGGGMGANAQMLKVPAAGLDVVVMVNREDVSSRELTLRILDACLPDLEAVKQSPKAAPVNGTFVSKGTGRVIHLYGEKGQQFASGDFVDIPVAFDADGVLRPATTAILPYKYSIALIGDRQSPTRIKYSDYGNADELVRAPPVRSSDLTSIVGQYRCDKADFEANISDVGMRTSGRFGTATYSLECLADGIWRARATSDAAGTMRGILCFDKDGFRFWSFCARALPFRRAA